MFIRLDVRPYTWVHSAGMLPCDAMPPVTPEQAEEICACGHHEHQAGDGPVPAGQIARPRPCATRGCGCPDFTHRWRVGGRAEEQAPARRHGQPGMDLAT
jgi:hypothetical protein